MTIGTVRLILKDPGEAKVSNLENAGRADEQIGWLKILHVHCTSGYQHSTDNYMVVLYFASIILILQLNMLKLKYIILLDILQLRDRHLCVFVLNLTTVQCEIKRLIG